MSVRGVGAGGEGMCLVKLSRSKCSSLEARDLSSKYVQIADAINSLNSSKQPLSPSCCLAIIRMPEQAGSSLLRQVQGQALVPSLGLLLSTGLEMLWSQVLTL